VKKYKAVAKAANIPRDLSNSTCTTNINFNELVTNKKMIRENIEATAATGQQKKAAQR
jgi:hypothetical protein